MRPADVARLLDALYQTDVSVFLQGPPGIGKTEVIRQLAERKEAVLIVRHPVFEEAVDQRGIPAADRDSKRTDWYAPSYLPDPSDDREFIFFIDELPQSEPSVQKAYARTLLERIVGDTPLPEKTFVVAAGNRGQDRAGAGKLFSHVKNRVMKIDMEVSNDDWHEWALANDVIPEVRSYLRFMPSALFDFDPSREDQQATPRSWAKVSTVTPHLPEDLMHPAVSGLVGEGQAAQYCAHVRLHKELPDIDACLRNPTGFKVPEKLDILYAFSAAVADRCKDKQAKTVDAAMTIGLRIPGDEFSLLLCKESMKVSKGAWRQAKQTQQVLKRHKNLLLGNEQ
jgi:ATPase family associated with various cellular activities (AAA)